MPEKILLFLENAADANHYFSSKPAWGDATVLFAATSGPAIYEIEQRGESCILPVEYGDPTQFAEIEQANYATAKRLFRALDDLMLEHSALLRPSPGDMGIIEFTYMHIFKFRVMDHLSTRLQIHRGLLENVQPDKLAFYTPETKPVEESLDFVGAPLDTQILSLLAETLNIPTMHLAPIHPRHATLHSHQQDSHSKLRQAISNTQLVRVGKDFWRHRTDLLGSRGPKHKPRLLFTLPNKNADLLIHSPEFRSDFRIATWKRGQSPTHLWPPRIKKDKKRPQKEVE